MTSSHTTQARAADTDHESMVRELCSAVDSADAEKFASWFADDARFRFGNAEPLIGRAAIAEATARTAGALNSLRHRVDQVVQFGSQLFCRFTIETSTPHGEPLALPCVTVIELAGGKIVDYQVHMDISPAMSSG